jgi:hypothetical protein
MKLIEKHIDDALSSSLTIDTTSKQAANIVADAE